MRGCEVLTVLESSSPPPQHRSTCKRRMIGLDKHREIAVGARGRGGMNGVGGDQKGRGMAYS